MHKVNYLLSLNRNLMNDLSQFSWWWSKADTRLLDVHICIQRIFLNNNYKPKYTLILHHQNALIATKLSFMFVLKMIRCVTKIEVKVRFQPQSLNMLLILISQKYQSIQFGRTGDSCLACNYIVYLINSNYYLSFQMLIWKRFKRLVLKTQN